MRTEVAIVGGGLAGLVVARSLHGAGTGFTLLEARERLGGRILSAGADGEPSNDGFDLGASWFWPEVQPELGALVHRLGLRLIDQHAEGDVLIEGGAGQALERYPPVLPEPTSVRIVGGTGALIRAVAHSLPADRIRLNARVTRIVLAPGGAELATDDGGRIGARQVVLAVPPRLLEETVHFSPMLDVVTAERWRRMPTWMAPHAKFFALYDCPFWRDAGLSGAAQSMVGPLIEIHDATTASGQAALFGFVGVPAAQRRRMGEKAIIAAAIAQLTRLFGTRAANPITTLFKDWAADPLVATENDQAGDERPYPDPQPWMNGDWRTCLVLAASETSRMKPGYLAGALEAAEHAAAEVLRRLGESSAETYDDLR